MRNGKIARLPATLRDEIDQRLDNGERTGELLAWLNSVPEAQAVLREQFAGKPVNKQNLSDWRRGGHQEWKQREEVRRTAQTLATEARELGQAADPSRPDGGIETLYGVALVTATQKMFAATTTIRQKTELLSVMSRGLVTVRTMVQRAEGKKLVEEARAQRRRMRAEWREFRERQRLERRLAAAKLKPAVPTEPPGAGAGAGKDCLSSPVKAGQAGNFST